MSLKLITGPASEAITLDEAKAHLRVTHNNEDAYITALIVAARECAEQATGRALLPQTWEAAFDHFCEKMALQKAPVTSITSIKYLDAGGVLQTLDPGQYELNDYLQPAQIVKPYLVTWPSTQTHTNAVIVRYVAGYANAAAVPQSIKSWMLLKIGVLYENREAETDIRGSMVRIETFDRLLDASKIWG